MEIKDLIDLHVTAGLDFPVLTKFLLDQGADVHARDDKGPYAAALCGVEKCL